MVVRLRLLASSLLGGGLLLAILCLGAQNLDQRPSLNLGFLVGIALVIGVLSGGCSAALLAPRNEQLPGD
jgi:hypothetical protein